MKVDDHENVDEIKVFINFKLYSFQLSNNRDIKNNNNTLFFNSINIPSQLARDVHEVKVISSLSQVNWREREITEPRKRGHELLKENIIVNSR